MRLGVVEPALGVGWGGRWRAVAPSGAGSDCCMHRMPPCAAFMQHSCACMCSACAAFMRHAHACGGGRIFSFVIYQFDSAACVDSNSRKITVLKNSCEGLSRMARVARARGARAHVRNVPSYVPPNSIVRNLESLDRCWCAHLFTLLIN
jgi:hypothetical protein